MSGPILWSVALVASLLLCSWLGRMETIGKSAPSVAAAAVGMLLLIAPLIHFFPFRRHGRWWLLAVAAAARVLVLPLAPADDVNRYVWEGRVLEAGVNPYQVAPDDPALAHLRDDTWAGINHPSMTAIYPPGALLVFRALAAVTIDPRGFKLAMTAIDLAAVALLLQWLVSLGRRPQWVLFYALNPLVLLAFAGEGHLDVLMVMPLLAALWAHRRGQTRWMWFWFALSLHGKYVSILLLPFLLNRRSLRTAWIFLPALALPFALLWPGPGMLDSFLAFSGDMHFNDSLHRVVATVLGDQALASLACAGLLAAWVAWVRVMTPRVETGAALVLGGLLLLSPTVHYWYLAWMIPFLCLTPVPGLMAWCGTLLFSFVTIHHLHVTNVWTEFPWTAMAEYLPVFALLAWGVVSPRRRAIADATPNSPAASISVILPALNDATMIRRFLNGPSCRAPEVREIIVCDGGSDDGTVEAAEKPGARIVRTAPGRGVQIAAGAERATGDVLLIAHADMEVDGAVPGRILDALNCTGLPGGCVGCRFDSPSLFLRLIGILNALRAEWVGVSFGDQGQFVRRDALQAMGGFPAFPLMEDVELSYRLRQAESPLHLRGGIVVSARRWRRRGHLRNTVDVLSLVAGFGWARLRGRTEHFVEMAYHRYYRRPPAAQSSDRASTLQTTASRHVQ